MPREHLKNQTMYERIPNPKDSLGIELTKKYGLPGNFRQLSSLIQVNPRPFLLGKRELNKYYQSEVAEFKSKFIETRELYELFQNNDKAIAGNSFKKSKIKS